MDTGGKSQGARTSPPPETKPGSADTAPERSAFPKGQRCLSTKDSSAYRGQLHAESPSRGSAPEQSLRTQGRAARPQEWDPDPSGPSHRGAPGASHGGRGWGSRSWRQWEGRRALCCSWSALAQLEGMSERVPGAARDPSSPHPREACPPRPKASKAQWLRSSGPSGAHIHPGAPWWSPHRTGPESLGGQPS